MEIVKFKVKDIDFDIKILVSMKDCEDNNYYSYIDIDKEKIKEGIKDMLFIGKPSKFGIEREIHSVVDTLFEEVIEEKKPCDMELEVEDDFGDVIEVDTRNLEWDWILTVRVDNLKYELQEV